MLRGRSVPLLLALSLTLLTGAWILGNPPSAAPDEIAHYIKALGAGGGELVGKPPPRADMAPTVESEASSLIRGGEPRATALKIATWQWRTSRMFQVPAGALSSSFGCSAQQEAVSWACLGTGRPTPATSRDLESYVGTYPPFVYVPSGLLARANTSANTRVLLGRAGMGAVALIMLIAATFVLWDSEIGGLSLVGLLLAVTPMVVFISSALTASGPEVTSAICFAAALLRLGRDQRSSPWVWAICALSGVVLALSRELGPEFVVLQILAVGLALGWRQIRALFLRRGAVFGWIVVACACVLGVFWDMHYNVHPPTSIGAVLAVVPSSVKELAAITRQEIGNFGVLDSPLPMPAYLAWLGMLGVLLVVAFRISERSLAQRLGLLVGGVVTCTVLLTSFQRQTGFSFQGRYVLPIFVLLPLCAGELVCRHASRLSTTASKRLVVGITATAGLIQALAWYANGRRVAVGVHGSWLYALSPKWQPPLGWLPWTALVLIAFGLYLVAARWGTPRFHVPGAGVVAGFDSASGGSTIRRARVARALWLRPGRTAAAQSPQSRD